MNFLSFFFTLVFLNEIFNFHLNYQDNYFLIIIFIFMNYELIFFFFSISEWILSRRFLKLRRQLKNELLKKKLMKNLHKNC